MNQQRLDEIRERANNESIYSPPVTDPAWKVMVSMHEDITVLLEHIKRLQTENAELRARLENAIIIPDIKMRKTLYWIWGDEVMPVTYYGVSHGNTGDNGKFRVFHNMRTKKRREIPYAYRKKPGIYVYEKGDRRIFTTDSIGITVFYTRKEAEAALKARKTEDKV
jgi:hypothetical protein